MSLALFRFLTRIIDTEHNTEKITCPASILMQSLRGVDRYDRTTSSFSRTLLIAWNSTNIIVEMRRILKLFAI